MIDRVLLNRMLKFSRIVQSWLVKCAAISLFCVLLQNPARAAESLYDVATNEAFQAYKSADYARAVKMFEIAAKECDRLGKIEREKVIILNGLAVSYCGALQFTKAQEISSEALALCAGGMKTDDPLFVKTQQNYDQIMARAKNKNGNHIGNTEHNAVDTPQESNSCTGLQLNVDGAVPLGQNMSKISLSQDETSLKKTLDGTTKAELSDKLESKAKPLYKRMLQKSAFWRLRYYFVAQNAHNCDFFYGQVIDNAIIGKAAVDFAFPNGCKCRGTAKVTYYPPNTFSCAGQKGNIFANCSDGRSMNGEFTTASLTTGHGTLSDSLGNAYQFTFGHTADQAIKTVNVLRKKMRCPDCSTKDIAENYSASSRQ